MLFRSCSNLCLVLIILQYFCLLSTYAAEFSIQPSWTSVNTVKKLADSTEPLPNEFLHTAGYLSLSTYQSANFTIQASSISISSPIIIELSVYYGEFAIYASYNSVPTPTNHDYATTSDGPQDFISIMPTSSSSNIYISFVATTDSFAHGFAFQHDDAIPLVLGTPVKFSSMMDSSIHVVNFNFNLADLRQVSIVLTMISGGAQNSPKSPMIALTTSQSVIVFHDFYQYLPSTSDLSQPLQIQVACNNSMTFTLVVNYLDSTSNPTLLLDGIPQYDSVPLHREKYYLLQVSPSVVTASGDIVISLNTLYGDADLFVNPIPKGFFKYQNLSSSPSVWNSRHPQGIDLITIKNSDHNYVDYPSSFPIGDVVRSNTFGYLITVYGFSASSYILTTSHSNGVMTLIEELPVQGTVRKGKYNYYRFFDTFIASQFNPAVVDTVMFDLQPSSVNGIMIGDADLYIACKTVPTGNDHGTPSKSKGHYNFTATSFSEDAIAIRSDSPNSCAYRSTGSTSRSLFGSVFYLAVYGYTDATYTLKAMHSLGASRLYAGVPSTSTVFVHLAQYYQIYVGFEAMDLKITLTSEYGDADLLAKVNDRVSLTSYDYRSSNGGSRPDEIVIREQAICQNCYINIMVYGYTTAKFQIVASFYDGSIQLFNGVPQKGSVGDARTQYYTYLPTRRSTVYAVLTLTSNIGAPCLFLSKLVQHPNDTSPTTLRDCTGNDGTLPILIMGNVSQHDVVYIGVGGLQAQNASYTIRISETYPEQQVLPRVSLLTLLDGQPQNDFIEPDELFPAANCTNCWKYYKVSAPPGHDSIAIRASAFIGSIDLYEIKCPTISSYQCAMPKNLPNQTHYSLSTVNSEDVTDRLVLFRNDPVDSLYLIGVYSSSFFALYQISTSFTSTILALQPGVGVSDRVLQNEAEYFSFYFDHSISDADELYITLTTTSGDPDLYVSTKTKHPGPSNSTWQSLKFGPDVLTIDPAVDKKACVRCTYYIAVYGVSPSRFIIMASVLSTLPMLSNGIPMSGQVTSLKWNCYVFNLKFSTPQNVRIHLSSTSGNADLFVNLDGTKPSLSHYAYRSTNMFSADEVFISKSDPAYQICNVPNQHGVQCSIVIGVFGFLTSQYVITLTTESVVTVLQLGVPQSGTVAINQYVPYKVQASPSSKTPSIFTLIFSVTPFAGEMSLYVSCGSSMPSTFTPNRTNHMWSLKPIDMGTGSTSLSINSLSVADKGCLASTPFYASIHGDGHSGVYAISVDLKKQVNDSFSYLLTNIPSMGTVGYHAFSYYSLRLPFGENNVHLTLTALTGDVDIYISLGWDNRPVYVRNSTAGYGRGSVQSYLLSSTNTGNDDMVLSHNSIDGWCDNRPYCYIIIGVFGTVHRSYSPGNSGHDVNHAWHNYTHDPFSFSLVAHTEDSTLMLSNGIPQRGTVRKDHYQYYRFTLLHPNSDVYIVVTPLNNGGDPDMFVSLAPNYHPTRSNYTWFHSAYGTDSLTIQSNDIMKYCTPKPSIGKSCSFYIGVFGWKNTSYSILATVNNGFESPIYLNDYYPLSGSVDTGFYRYYKYYVNIQPPFDGSPIIPVAIKFTLTTTNGGDADLYVKFGQSNDLLEDSYGYYNNYYQEDDNMTESNANANASRNEPGMNNFDYKSTKYSSVNDEITINPSMPHYCLNCVIYLAVYGYKQSTYTLQSTSTGVTRLQANRALGGHVAQGGYSYFALYNTIELAEITLTLTTISGDADIYVTEFKEGGVFSLPMKGSATWSSVRFGDDSIHINYLDPHFCSSCDYVIAVYGYRNSTFTLIATDQEAAVIALVPNRPQSTSITSAGKIRFFSIVADNSLVDLSISLTPHNTGTANMYLQLYNASDFYSAGGGDRYILPDPNNPTTYRISTVGTHDNHLYAPATLHGVDEDCVYIIAVVALSPIVFSIVASSSHSVTLLQLGVPQNHFVETGKNAFFSFYPNDDLEDIRITVTARSGDPDLFVSTSAHPLPHCDLNGNFFSCHNYTWSSRSFATDQIVISRDFPCKSVLSTTLISRTCQPDQVFLPGSMQTVFFVDVFGYRAAKFTILAASIGQQVMLLPGIPQVSTTSIGYICSNRSPQTGACIDSSSTTSPSVIRQVQVAYFSFETSPTAPLSSLNNRQLDVSLIPTADVLFTFTPMCNSSAFDSYNVTTTTATATVSPSLPGTVVPHFPGGGGGGTKTCPPGCACNPLVIYINSCSSSQCTESSRKPSELPNQHMLKMVVTSPSVGSTLLLTQFDVKTGARNAVFCDPNQVLENCHYFIAVVANGDLTQSAAFTVVANTPTDVNLIPCDNKYYPDGVKVSTEDFISQTGPSGQTGNGAAHYYELCGGTTSSNKQTLLTSTTVGAVGYGEEVLDRFGTASGTPLDGNLVVELEQCFGSTDLYACAEDHPCDSLLPTVSKWGFFSDGDQSCVQSWSSPSNSPQCTVLPNRGKPTLTLPPIASSTNGGNYYLMAYGPGNFNLRVYWTSNGAVIAPKVVLSVDSTGSNPVTTASVTTGNTVTLQFCPSAVTMPGLTQPVSAPLMTYLAYVFDMDTIQTTASSGNNLAMLQFNTSCGLKYAAELLIKTSKQFPIPWTGNANLLTATLNQLTNNKHYVIYLTATCNSACLAQLTKTSAASASISCSTSAELCKSQNLVYPPFYIQTALKPDPDSNSDGSNDNNSASTMDLHFVNSIIAISVVSLVLIFLLIVAVLAYQYNYANGTKDLDTMTEMVESIHFGGTGGDLGTSHTSIYKLKDNSSSSAPSKSYGMLGKLGGTPGGPSAFSRFISNPMLSSKGTGSGGRSGHNPFDDLDGDDTTSGYVPPGQSGADVNASSSSLKSLINNVGSSMIPSWKMSSSGGGVTNPFGTGERKKGYKNVQSSGSSHNPYDDDDDEEVDVQL